MAKAGAHGKEQQSKHQAPEERDEQQGAQSIGYKTGSEQKQGGQHEHRPIGYFRHRQLALSNLFTCAHYHLAALKSEDRAADQGAGKNHGDRRPSADVTADDDKEINFRRREGEK